MKTWASKDPDEILDYQIRWANRLIDDTIASSTWEVPAGITEEDNSFADYRTYIWLSGGTAGETYTITNRITTAAGRTMDQSVSITVEAK
jgi:hypothetical protein